MSAHSTVVGGSSATRVKMCPASVRLSQAVPPQPSSPYAREGTALHTVMEHALLDDRWRETPKSHVPAKGVIGMEIEGVEITSDLYYDKLVPAGEAVDKLFKQYGVEEYEAEAVVRSETITGAFGTCDIVAVTKDGRLVIADFKFGDGVIVDASENGQLMFYAACALEDKDLREWLKGKGENIVTAIIQPARSSTLDVWETTGKRVAVFFAELLISVDASGKDKLRPNPGEWCRWCPAAPTCPAKREQALRLQGIDADTAEALSEALKLADEVEPWIRKLRKQAHELMDDGNAIPGYKLVRTDARRRWTDEDGAKTALKRSKALTRGDYVKETLLSPPQLEKLCKQKGVDFSVFADYYDAVSTGTAVVPEGHAKPAIATKAGKVDLTQQTEPEKETENV